MAKVSEKQKISSHIITRREEPFKKQNASSRSCEEALLFSIATTHLPEDSRLRISFCRN
jgi:hypothetical protein